MSIKRLHIFESFVVDHNLPKFKTDGYVGFGVVSNRIDSAITNISNINASGQTTWSGGKKSGFITGLLAKVKAWHKARKEAAEEADKRMPDGVMDDAHVFMQSLASTMSPEMKDRLAQFDVQLEGARKMGQAGLVERLEALRKRVAYELSMASGGFQKYLTEEQVVKLINECKKGLTVTWVKDFGRVIPIAVLNLKVKADELKVFDNYVVLHFDPDKKDIMPPKDPILFGVIRNSTRLYFVGDWVDDVCDFTLEKAEKFLTESGETNPIGNVMEKMEEN